MLFLAVVFSTSKLDSVNPTMGANGKKKGFVAAQEAEQDSVLAINPITPDLFAFGLQLFGMK